MESTLMAQASQHPSWQTDTEHATVPVLVDDQKRDLPGFEMTRCVYLAVDYDGLQADWLVGQPLASRILLSDFAGIITGPEEGGLFSTPEQIEQVFEQLEKESDEGSFRWVVEFEDLWIPNALVEGAVGKHENPAGIVLRAHVDLVRAALRFSREQIPLERYLEFCRSLIDPVQNSPEETRALKEWGRGEIERAKGEYKRLMKLGRIRPWRDAEGNLYLGNERIEEPME